MSMQQQRHHSNKWQQLGQHLKHLPWVRLLIFLFAVALITIGAITWIQNSSSKDHLPNIISITFGAASLVGVLLQWLFPLPALSKSTPPVSTQPIQFPPTPQPLPPVPTPPQNVSEPSPAIWNVPYRRNPFFTGREEILTHLHTILNSNKATALTQPQAISGLGGIGKTQTTIEYAYRHRNDYQYVFWTSAETHEALVSGFVTIAGLLNLPEKDAQDQSRIVTAVKRWLETHKDWLLILDNADDLNMANDFIPPASKGYILLTTRAQATEPIAQGIDIEKMELDEGTLFLLRRAGVLAKNALLANASPADLTTAREIVQAMGGLPLALDQAGAYVYETKCSLSSYLKLYQQRRSDLLKRRGGVASDHPLPVASTWSLSFKKVQKANPVAADLLRLCAFLPSNSIPEEIITKGTPVLSQLLQSVAADPDKLNAAIGELGKYSLVRRNSDQTLTVHRLVQAVLKDEMNQQIQLQWAERTVRVVNLVFPRVEYTTWPQCKRYLPHARVCANLIEQWDMAFPEAARLLNQAGYYLKQRAQYTEAEPLYQRALTIREKVLDHDHPAVATSLNNLAELYRVQGKYAQTEQFYQRALAIDEKVFGLEHPEVATDLNNLAGLYRVQGKYEQAELLYQQALVIREKKLGPNHPDVATSLNNLALLYYVQGKYTQAEPRFQRALAIRKKALGSDHPDVAISLNGLALLYDAQGKYIQAEHLFQRALVILEKTLGPGHPNVASCIENYAMLLRKTKRENEAAKLEAQAREIQARHAAEKPDVELF